MKISNNKLDKVIGGTNTVSGTLVRAFTGLIEVLLDAGRGLGSSIRRISEDNKCEIP